MYKNVNAFKNAGISMTVVYWSTTGNHEALTGRFAALSDNLSKINQDV